ncbi:MAG: hypothetical protein CMP58_04610, partial [Flavobacteriales bacterium]|nr:hypothetical protein [Flavobacteriales bacterium]
YGCVNISGTPIYPGLYNVEVTLTIDHSFSSIAGPIDIDFQIPFEVLPDTSTISNNGFSMLGSSSCNSTLVNFTNNNPGLMYYSWDFGNGNLSNAENPLPQFYSGNNTSYVVSYNAWDDTTTTYMYTLDQVGIVNVFDDWDWGYLSAFGVCTGECNPDIFIEIYDDNTGNQVYYGNYYLDTWYPNYWSPNIVLDQSSTYTMYVTEWDDGEALGVFGGDDNLGSIQFSVVNGTTLLNNSDVQSSITISSLVLPSNPVVSSVDTVFILPSPISPLVNYDSLSNILSSSNSSFSMQWYYNGGPVPGATSNQFSPIYSGYYYLLFFNQFGCSSSSDTINVTICSNSIIPDVSINNSIASVNNNNMFVSYSLFNSNGNLIQNTTNSTFSFNSSGDYYLAAVDSFGCVFYSDTFLICSNAQQPVLSYNSTSSQFYVVDSSNYVFYNWYNNGYQILNQNNSDLNAISSGYYSVESLDVFGCSYNSSEILHCDQNHTPSVFNFEKLFWTSDTIGIVDYQWYFNGVDVFGANSPFFVPDNFIGGGYHIEVTDTFGCVYQSEIMSVSPVFNNSNNILSIYPNPTKDLLYINNMNTNTIIYVFDILGNLVSSDFVDNNKKHIDLSFLSQGVYTIKYNVKDFQYSGKVLKIN